MVAHGTFAEVVARRSFVAVKAKAFRVPVRHGECSVRDRHKKDCRFYWEYDARRRHSSLRIRLERRRRHVPSGRAAL